MLPAQVLALLLSFAMCFWFYFYLLRPFLQTSKKVGTLHTELDAGLQYQFGGCKQAIRQAQTELVILLNLLPQESRRVAELLSQLPPEMDVETLVANASMQEEEEEEEHRHDAAAAAAASAQGQKAGQFVAARGCH